MAFLLLAVTSRSADGLSSSALSCLYCSGSSDWVGSGVREVSTVLSDSCSYLYGFSPLLSKALFLLFDRAISASVCSFLIPFLLEVSRNEAGSWLTLMDVCWHWLSCCQPLTVQFSFQFDLRENGWFWLAFRREWVRLFDNEWGLPIGSACHVIFLAPLFLVTGR